MKSKKWVILLVIALLSSCKERRNLEFTCRIEAKYAELSAPYPAKVQKITVVEGEEVKRGEPVIILDTEELSLQLKAVESEIKSSLHQMKKLRALLSNIERNLRRAENLERVGGATKVNVENLQLKRESTIQDIESLEKKIEAGRYRKELLLKKIREGTIRSPADGKVIEVPFEEGERVMPGFTLVKIELKGKRFARCYVSHSALSEVRVGNMVILEGSNTSERGEIYFVSSEPEFTPRYFISDNERDLLHYEFRVKVSDKAHFANGEFVKVYLLE